MMLFIITVLLFYILANDYALAIAQLRDHIFPIILFLAVNSFDWNISQIRSLIMAVFTGAFFASLGGFVQYFFANIPISLIKGTIEFIDSNGYIQYTTTSPRIMGLERMSGLFSGPNDFGLYCGLMLSIGIFLLTSRLRLMTHLNLNKVFIRITTLLLVICLFLSFSRAGWIIFLITILYLVFSKRIFFSKRTVIYTGILVSAGFIGALIYFPAALDVVVGSITGEEASAASRSGNFRSGLDVVLSEPFGHGLGKSDRRSASYEFFAESAFLNTSYEIGVIGFALNFIIYLSLAVQLYKKKHKNYFTVISLGITIGSLVVSFVSINTYGMPYIYLWWLLLGLGLSNVRIRCGVKASTPSFKIA